MGIEEKKPGILINVFPDPAKDLITVEIPGPAAAALQNGSIFIYNLMGRLMLKQTVSSSKTRIDINSLPSGLYLIRVVQNGVAGSGKFIRE